MTQVNIDNYLLEILKPGQYLGNEINSIHKKEYQTHMCLFFPDIYEVGMSNLGIRILYNILNKLKGFYLERGFCPMEDLEEKMREYQIPMFSWETKTPLKEFDIVGFSLSYEMAYPNLLSRNSFSLERPRRRIPTANGRGNLYDESYCDFSFYGLYRDRGRRGRHAGNC